MNALFWIGVYFVLFGLWMWWEVAHAGEVPDDYVDYDENWFDDRSKSKVKQH